MSETRAPAKPPLDEVMLAMDVVDTLRHRELIVQRELSADHRDQQLIERLRGIYAGQGIEVSDDVLERGVRDLRENRFVYVPPAPSLSHTLARIYVSRRRWAPPIGFTAAIVAAVLIGWQVLVRGPALEAIAQLPQTLQRAHAAVVDLAEEAGVDAQADALLATGQQALNREDHTATEAVIADLNELQTQLSLQYELQVVSRPGQLSGVWRVPDSNPNAQNYYLIVEAVDPSGQRLTLPIISEETGRSRRVEMWGQRVEEPLFRSTADDKRDDGILQDDVIGTKHRGFLAPDREPGVLGGAITDW